MWFISSRWLRHYLYSTHWLFVVCCCCVVVSVSADEPPVPNQLGVYVVETSCYLNPDAHWGWPWGEMEDEMISINELVSINETNLGHRVTSLDVVVVVLFCRPRNTTTKPSICLLCYVSFSFPFPTLYPHAHTPTPHIHTYTHTHTYRHWDYFTSSAKGMSANT